MTLPRIPLCDEVMVEEPTLRTQIVAAIMGLMKPPKPVKVSLDQLERILNSETQSDIQINPDGTIGEQELLSTTVGAVADAVIELLERRAAETSKPCDEVEF